MPEYALFGCPVFNTCRSEDGEKENVSAEWHGARVRKDGKKARQNIGTRDRENMSARLAYGRYRIACLAHG